MIWSGCQWSGPLTSTVNVTVKAGLRAVCEGFDIQTDPSGDGIRRVARCADDRGVEDGLGIGPLTVHDSAVAIDGKRSALVDRQLLQQHPDAHR
jgi:hypothetical protein